jgi:hypothetical protein
MALLVTLGLVMLATLLVVSLFSISTIGKNEGSAYLNGRVAEVMVDNAIAVAVAQLQSSTTMKQENGLPKLWVSQPGAITVFDYDGRPSGVQKLYSSNVPTLFGDNLPSVDDIAAADVPLGWENQRDVFVDLNGPVSEPDGLHYPILDPRLLAGGVEGLATTHSGGLMQMPVRWLYLLEDGTLGTVDSAGQFTALEASLSDRSKTSPIMARFAYWVDDETCKINVNTAAEGAYWDAPIADTDQERYMAKQQPSFAEYARMPGHPAGVCLSSVFSPGERFYPDGFYDAQNGPALSNDALSLLWEVGRQPQKLVPLAGRESSYWNEIWGDDLPAIIRRHRYATLDEMVFDTGAAGPSRVMSAFFASNPARITRLSQAGGVLTAQSRAPDLTPFGTPRISTWPVHAQTLQNIRAKAGVGKEANSKDTIYNHKAAYASMVRDTPYFMQRSEPGNGGADLEFNAGGENEKLRAYLELMTDRPMPGWASNVWQHNTFAEKYGADMPGINIGALDYIRSTNLADGQLAPNSQFSILCPGHGNESYGFGQISPLQKRLKGQEYLVSRQTQSLGRICTVSEIALVISCRAQVVRRDGVLVVDGDPSSRNRNALRRGKEGDRELEVHLVTETFLPGHSWADYRPYITAALAGGGPGVVVPFKNSASKADFPVLRLNGQELKWDVNKMKMTSSNRFHRDWSGAGGALGILSLSEGTIGFEPIVVSASVTGVETAVDFRGGSEQLKELKLVIYDSAQGAAEYDVHQIIPLKLPDIPAASKVGVPQLPQSISPSFAARIQSSVANSTPVLHQEDIVQGLSPAHGDYRVTASQRWLEQGAGSDRLLHFVPHPAWGTRKGAHDLFDKTLLPAGSGAGARGPISGLDYSTPGDIPTTLADPARRLTVWHGGQWKTVSAEVLTGMMRKDGGDRGAASPTETGDFDNGLGASPDGAYSNRQDDGHWAAIQQEGKTPYFSNVSQTQPSIPPVTAHGFNAQRLIPSAVVMGSLPTGASSGVPWQTLLFRPQPGHYGAKELPDHLFLELFQTPVLEPYALSLNHETEGRINLNQEMIPFRHVKRKTALHALLKAETLTAIPDKDAAIYKSGEAAGERYRRFIDAEATLKLWDSQLSAQRGLCRTASQLCELYLAPQGLAAPGQSLATEEMRAFWQEHRLTGDNSRERPYARIYPRITTQSNSYRMHFRVQVIKPSGQSAPGHFSSYSGKVLAERSGSVQLRRQLDIERPHLPADKRPKVPDYRAGLPDGEEVKPLTDFYRWTRGPLER